MPRLTDKQRLEQFRRQLQTYPQWDANRQQRALVGAFDRGVSNNDDYMSTIYDAASQNKPVVMFIGSTKDSASRYLIENSLKEARARNGRDAVYAFVDVDKVDRNSAIGKYIFENMPRKGQEPPFTMVFGMSRGDANNPVKADPPSFYKSGPLDVFAVNEAVSREKLNMNGRGLAQIDPRVQEAFALALVQAQRQTDKETAYNSYKRAVDIADNAKNPLLQSVARTELGLACVNWGFAETGYKWIMEGASKNADCYNNQKNQAFRERLKQAGVPQAAVDLLIARGQADPNWHQKDKDAGKIIEAAAKMKQQPEPANPYRRKSPFS